MHARRTTCVGMHARRTTCVVLQEEPAEPVAEATEEPADKPAELSYIEEQKAKFSAASDAAGGASSSDDAAEVRLAVPAFFAKREEERPGDARGVGGLNEQGYEPYDPSALDTGDTKPIFIALGLALLASAALSATNML